MLGFCRDGTAVALVLLNALALIAAADEEVIFTDHFLVQLHEGTNEDAHQLALEHGFGSARKLPFGVGLFHFYPREIPKTRRKRSLQQHRRLAKDHRVKNVFPQEGFGRQKRGYREISNIDVNMSDPLFTKQWYLINTGQADGTPGLDLNVAEAWNMGFTGKGVTIAIMDDGIDYLHPDLASNYQSYTRRKTACKRLFLVCACA
ncbi:Neuroendocrine convertase 2 [Labeo rohita]|uniref:Proprotein convertase 2 n=1 Tax=Labeo rohita TaxID=84645 RepID=A0ABQ8M3G1_LABRO|nr:Neuroendocrine convertase 2 [Labeo rohita]